MEVCTTGSLFSQTSDDVVEIVHGREGWFLPTPECDMDAVSWSRGVRSIGPGALVCPLGPLGLNNRIQNISTDW
jgi:hypothetical protein